MNLPGQASAYTIFASTRRSLVSPTLVFSTALIESLFSVMERVYMVQRNGKRGTEHAPKHGWDERLLNDIEMVRNAITHRDRRPVGIDIDQRNNL